MADRPCDAYSLMTIIRPPDIIVGGLRFYRDFSSIFYLLISLFLTLRKFCILLHCQASQTEISKWNSTSLCQTVDSKSR